MRLTLRTLLAYLDDTLEPADHEDLGKKIESSDFATELIHRTRDTMRRLRLGAPAVHAEDSQDVLGGDMTADANTVAEYIDNTLPPEQVADFERICLEPGTEADIHLAEVASCHHVLTMVLGEPAEIDEDLRKRMYQLPEEADRSRTLRIEPAHQPPRAESPPPERSRIPIAPVEPEARETAVPDYLLAATVERHRRVRLIAAACILALICGLGAFVFWPTAEPVIPTEIAGLDLEQLEQGPQIESQPSGEAVERTQGPNSPAPPYVSEQPVVDPTTESESPLESDEDGQLPGGIVQDPVESALVEPEDSTPSVDPLGADPIEANSTEDPLNLEVTMPSAGTGTGLAEGVMEAPLPESPVPSLASSEPDLPVGDSADDRQEVPASPEPEGPMQVGNYLSGAAEVMLRLEPASSKWIRVAPRTAIATGDQLLTLPTFRPHISLNETNVYLAGGSRAMILEADDFGQRTTVGLEVLYGKLLFNASLNGGPLNLRFGEIRRAVQLGGSSSLAIEVRRIFVPGSNFEQETAPIEVKWYLTSGNIEMPTPGGGTQTINSPAVWKTIDGVDGIPVIFDELPVWIDHEEVTDLQRRAKKPVSERLIAGEPVEMGLLELNDESGLGRRQEVRTLAAQSSLHVGQFEPFVRSLNDLDQRRAWNDHIDSLRAALALSPDTAAQVRRAFEELRGLEAADELMKMVQGFSEEEIGITTEEQQNGALEDLLGWMNSENLDYRVLATYNLDQITGSSYKSGYRPESDPTQRERALRKLWDRLESSDLLPK